jgi:hypothetical protein
VPDLPLDRDGDNDDKSRSRLLLAMHEVRRCVECVAVAGGSVPTAPKAMTAITRRELVQELRELIAALDRRVPHVERAGEALIARDAAALKARALKRIEDLEREEAVQPS